MYEGRSTTDAVLAARILQEKHSTKHKVLHLLFVNLEKAYGRVSRELLWWCLLWHNLPETYVQTIMEVSEGSRTVVRSSCNYSESFTVRAGQQQRSALSTFIFVIIMDTLTQDIRGKSSLGACFVTMMLCCVKKIIRRGKGTKTIEGCIRRKRLTNQPTKDGIHMMLR